MFFMKKLQNHLKTAWLELTLPPFHRRKTKILISKFWNFYADFFKICCQLKKTDTKRPTKNLTEEVKELESSQDLKNKDIETIFLQLTGFARFLKIKAEIIHKIKKNAKAQKGSNG